MRVVVDYSFVDEMTGKTYWKGKSYDVDNKTGRRLLLIKKRGRYVASMERQSIVKKTADNPRVVYSPVYLQTNTMVYIENLYKIGGTETWLLNMIKKLDSKDSIMVVYNNNQGTVINELEKYCTVVQDKQNYVYNCKILVVATVVSSEIFSRINKKKAYQFIHADVSGMNQISTTVFKKNNFIDELVSVSEVARQGLFNLSGEDSKVLYNPLNDDIKKRKIKVFCSVGRGTKEKGTDRILELVRLFKEYNKDFIWLLCGTQVEQDSNEIIEELRKYKEVIFIGPAENNKQLMQLADWTVVPSTTESFCYTAYESLQQGTPVILTDFTEAKNIVTSNYNGLIIPLDKELYNKDLVEKIFSARKSRIKINDRFDLDLAKKIFGIE